MAAGATFPSQRSNLSLRRQGASLRSRPVGLVGKGGIPRRDAMSSKQERFRIAILDDYQNAALSLADWSVLDERATVTVFNDHLSDSDAVVERLEPFDLVCCVCVGR